MNKIFTCKHADPFVYLIPTCSIFHPIYPFQVLIGFGQDSNILIFNGGIQKCLVVDNLIDRFGTIEIEISIIFLQ